MYLSLFSSVYGPSKVVLLKGHPDGDGVGVVGEAVGKAVGVQVVRDVVGEVVGAAVGELV